jgi:hypothetical protein
MVTERTEWDAEHRAVHREHLRGSDGNLALSLLRHPTHPFPDEISEEPSILFDELRRVAMAYLKKVAALDSEVARVHEYLLKPQALAEFEWLPITWGDGRNVDPRGSFVVHRWKDGMELDRTIVLMAANRLLTDRQANDAEHFGVGLRVVIHVGRAIGSGKLPIRISGLSVCDLHRAAPPARAPELIRSLESYVRYVEDFVERTLRLQEADVRGVEFVTSELLRVAGVGTRTDVDSDEETVLTWTIDLRLVGDTIEFISAREQDQRAHTLEADAPHPKLFFRDPASCGSGHDAVTRSPMRDGIDRFREEASFLPAALKEPGRFEVRQSKVADPLGRQTNVQSVDTNRLGLRSDSLSAAQAYLRAREFFDFFERVDLLPDDYFKFARLPLLMRHRASFSSSPDGKAVRAQVRLVNRKKSNWPQLEVAFGSAALRHRWELPDDHGRRSAQPLGIAADPRWAWHEFGHVLSYAATGALELQFVHSVGDALAAVLNDATSCLAGDGLYDGATYPWIPAGRRHDRDAAAGWCWCGRRNGLRYVKTSFPPLLYKGYVEEQMLSSTVFRFYRAIGGHPENDEAMRKRAATATGYLLIRAVLLLGPSTIVPARSADALLSAMIDADIGTLAPGDEIFPGGALHKVLRWSFERQGLFATDNPDEYAEGYGRPPAVDVWVMDRRRNADPGGYDPVVLKWPEDLTPEEEEAEGPAWFADPNDGVRVEDGDIHVIVRNRGREAATNVAVRAWAAPAATGSLQWQTVGDTIIASVPAGDSVTAHIAAGLSGGPQYLFVEVSTIGDESNLDPATYLPSAGDVPPSEREVVRDLVANDNNLALRLIP